MKNSDYKRTKLIKKVENWKEEFEKIEAELDWLEMMKNDNQFRYRNYYH